MQAVGVIDVEELADGFIVTEAYAEEERPFVIDATGLEVGI
jgi:hypothetical protein